MNPERTTVFRRFGTMRGSPADPGDGIMPETQCRNQKRSDAFGKFAAGDAAESGLVRIGKVAVVAPMAMDVEKAGEKGFSLQIQDPVRLDSGKVFLTRKKQSGNPLSVYEHGAADDFESGRKNMCILEQNLQVMLCFPGSGTGERIRIT